MPQSDIIHIDIGVCTFRRLHIAETLKSLAAQVLPANFAVRVIVADNDLTPSARDLVLATAAACQLKVDYVHAPACNISIARNACLDYARADWFAFVDDDEVADAHWLAILYNEALAAGADVMFGPAIAVYGEDAADWVKHGDFHSNRVVYENGEVRTGYSCNVLMKRALVEKTGLRFPLLAGVQGGEDTLFFGELWRSGAKLGYTPLALLHEPVPPQRASLKWLLRRAFRSGQSHAQMVLQRNVWSRPFRIGLGLVKSGICAGLVCASFWSRFLWRRWLIRGAMHTGITLRLLGIQV